MMGKEHICVASALQKALQLISNTVSSTDCHVEQIFSAQGKAVAKAYLMFKENVKGQLLVPKNKDIQLLTEAIKVY